jgi:hypothetical protein
MNKTETIQKNILSKVCFMTFCPILTGQAKKDDFRGITAKNADQKRFFSNFVGLAPYP